MKIGTILLVALGGFVLFVLLAALGATTFCWLRRRKSRSADPEAAVLPPPASAHTPPPAAGTSASATAASSSSPPLPPPAAGTSASAAAAASSSSSPPPPPLHWTQLVKVFRQGVAGHPSLDQNYDWEKDILRGDTFVVWQGVRKQNTATTHGTLPVEGRRVACKTMPWSTLEPPKVLEELGRELSIIASLPAHPSLLRLHEVYEEEDALHLVTDVYGGSSLSDRINGQCPMEEDEAAKVVRTVLEAVAILHSASVVHGNLMPQSFMFSGTGEDENLKLIDFSKACSVRGATFKDDLGSYLYMAPEVFEGQYGPEADVWTTGVIAYQLLYGRHPFPAATSDDGDAYDSQRQATLRGTADMWRHPWPTLTVSDGAKNLVLAMLEPDPRRRLTALQVLEHPYWLKAPALATV